MKCYEIIVLILVNNLEQESFIENKDLIQSNIYVTLILDNCARMMENMSFLKH